MNNMEKLLLSDATDAQVRDFARIFLQLEGADSKEIKKVRADVTAAWLQDFIWMAKPVEALQLVAGTDVVKPALTKEQIDAKAGPGIAASSSKGDPVVVLVIPVQQGPGGKDPVFLNVNGSAMHIARGMKQRVPYRYFHDLKNAVQGIMDQDEKTFAVSTARVERFPFTVHEMPSADEIFAFELLDAQRCGQTITREQFDERRRKEDAAELAQSQQDEIERVAGLTKSA